MVDWRFPQIILIDRLSSTTSREDVGVPMIVLSNFSFMN